MTRRYCDFARALPGRLLTAGILLFAIAGGLSGQTSTFRYHGATEAVELMFKRFDSNGDGSISTSELRRFGGNGSGEPRDYDGNGKISAAEFQRSFREVYEFHPGNRRLLVVGHIQAAKKLLVSGYVDQAASSARSIVASFPEWAEGWVLLGDVAKQLWEDEQAMTAYRKAVELAPNSDSAWFAMSSALAASNKTTECDQAVARGLELLGIKYELYGRDSITSVDFDYTKQASRLMSRYMVESRRPDIALRIGDWTTQRYGPRPEIEAQKLLAKSMLGQSAEALAAAVSATKTTTAGRYHFLLAQARIQMMSGQGHEAIERLKEALTFPEVAEDQHQIRMNLFSLLTREQKSEEAQAVLDKALAQAVVPSRKLQLARLLIRTGQPAKAAELLEDAVTKARGAPDYWLNLALARGALDDRAGYIAALEEGRAHCESQRFREQAAEDIENAQNGGDLPEPREPGGN